MSVGTYGNNIPATFIPSDHAEVWFSYRENRSVTGDGFSIVETTLFLEPEVMPNDENNYISGLYRLKLPVSVFNKTGIYNLYIRPKQIETTIEDIGVLDAYPEIRGVIVSASGIPNSNDELTGYKIEYYDASNVKTANLFRIVTSSNKCEPTNQGINGSTSYRFNENSNLLFLTVTPSSSSSAKPNSLPYIGKPQDKIIMSNTFFNPEMIEIEMTDNDLESLFVSMNGNQIRTLDNGLVTTYDKNKAIVNQVEHYLIKETATGKPIYEIRETKVDIIQQDFNEITGNV